LDKPWILRSVWLLLSHNGQIINSPDIRLAGRPPETNSVNIPLWTDDFTSLFQILRSQTGPQIDPVFSEAQSRIANNLCQQGDFAGAVASYRLALQSHSDLPELNNNLAWLLATCPDAHIRDGAQAVGYAERACALTHYAVTPMVGTLAAAFAEAGRFDDAIAMAQKACALASAAGEQSLLQKNQELLVLYQKHQPYHEPFEKLVPVAP
jgi:tetratricopeptide (TPR) repeat protein